MMFEISKNAIEGATVILSKVINAKNPLPILGDILCEVKDNQLTMTGSDGECSIRTTLELNAMAGDGKFCLDAGRLLTALRQLPEQPLQITCCAESDYMFTIEHQDGQMHFLAESADEYPVIDDITIVQQFDDIDGERIGAAIKRCLWSAASDELRPAMCGVHMCTVQKYDVLDIVASDGHSLVRSRLTNIGIEPDAKISAILPTKAAKILADTLEEGDISLRFSEDKCQVETYRYRMTFRLTDAVYPKYNSVIPSDNGIEAWVDKAALLRAIKRTLPFTTDTTMLLSLHFDSDILTVTGNDFDFSEGASDKISVDFASSAPLTIGLKGSTLGKALGYIDHHKVIIQMKDASTAVLLVPADDEENTQVTILLMPMLLND